VPRRRLIDVDEFGATFEKCNRTGGWAMKVMRVQKDGHCHHGIKITVIFAIEPGDPALPPHVRGRGSTPRFAKISNALFDPKKCSDLLKLLT